MRISAARRSDRRHDPLDHRVVHPLEIQRSDVLDPDPEIVEDPAVGLALPAPGSKVTELVQQQADQILPRQALDEREGAHRVRVVEGVHQAPLSDPPQIDLSEEDDLPASDGKLGPRQGRLGLGDEQTHQIEGEFETPCGRALTGRELKKPAGRHSPSPSEPP
jgi:hypothetical protein